MDPRLATTKIGFIGAGNMALAIAEGLILKKVVDKLSVAGPHPENYKKWEPFATVCKENWKVIQECNLLFICVKPHQLQAVVQDIAANCNKFVVADKVFVTVLAGISKAHIYKTFAAALPQLQPRIVRTMPNICLQVGEGCCMVAENDINEDPKGDADFVSWLMNKIGTSAIVPEDKFSAYTGLCGSGPAYIFLIIEGLADGAVKQGVPRELAIKFASQTVCGAAQTQLVTGKHPGVLKDEVCSPGGTTIAAVHELEKGGLRSILMNAVEAAANKAISMAPK